MKRTHQFLSLLVLLIAAVLCCAPCAQAEERQPRDCWTVLTGGGSSHKGWGATDQTVQTADLYFRYSNVIRPKMGWDYLLASHELWIELPVILTYEPETHVMLSAVFNFAMVFDSWEYIEPYFFVGGGPLYITSTLPGMGSKFCGNYQAGGGVRVPINKNLSLNFESRYHHVSNGGLWEPNVPINSAKFLTGISYNF